MSDIFKAIADPTRREILMMLAQNSESVNTISEKFSMSRPAVSKHIRILRANDLVHISSDGDDGRQRICHVQLEALKEVDGYLEDLRTFWNGKLKGLGNYLEKN